MNDGPILSPGFVRLYRIGSLPKDYPLYGMTPESPEFPQLDWVDQAVVEAGDNHAVGRWFTPDRSAVDWYGENENWGRPLYCVDIPETQALEWLVASNPQVHRFSRDPENEYFIPADIANEAKPVPGYMPPRAMDGRPAMRRAVDAPRLA
jgi:hypothetical protein